MMSKSELEERFAYLLGLYAVDSWEREYHFAPPRKWSFDFAWVVERVAVEIDGGQWSPHGGRHNTDADRWKLNEAASRDWIVLRFSSAMLDDPHKCMDVLKRALRREIGGR